MKHWDECLTRYGTWSSLFLAFALAACTPSSSAPGPGPAGGLPTAEPVVRVGLVVDTATITVEGSVDLEVWAGGSNQRITRFTAGQAFDIQAGPNGLVLPALANAGSFQSLSVRQTGDGFISIAGRTYRGDATFLSTGPGTLTAINDVPMERYLLGVVPFEIGRVGEELTEAAKAQAVAARTYALRYLGRRASLGFDVFATVADQVYGGAAGEHDPVSRAVLATAGEVLTYQGDLVEAFYHSTCAGQTAAIEEVWPQESPRPYLVSVIDRDPASGTAFDESSNRFRWTQTWTADELTSTLHQTLADSLPAGVTSVGEIENLQVLERTASGRIAQLRITTSTATFDVGRDQIRWIFLTPEGRILNSSKFDVDISRDSAGAITAVTATGGGWGHGIGMCQVGAMGRARAGQDYGTILSAYYPNTVLAKPY